MNVRARVEYLVRKYRTRDPFEMIQGCLLYTSDAADD